MVNIAVLMILEISKIENMSGFHYLQTLDMSRNRLLSLAGLESMTALRELRVAQNQIVSLEGLQTLQSLILLDLSRNQIADLRELLRLKANRNLKELSIKGNPIALSK